MDLRIDLNKKNLIEANLSRANLIGADLRGADLSRASLIEADLSRANLSRANLIGADLSRASLIEADLRGVDLRGANLSRANLIGADLENIYYSHNTLGINCVCPQKGSFIGYKKACGCIVELLILEDSKRLSGTSRKCRCDKAKVLSIIDIENGEEIEEVESDYDQRFIYKVGEIVRVDDFDENRWSECSRGIHFFIDRDEAINY